MKIGEFLDGLSSYAGDYHKEVAASVKKNWHMNDLTKEDLKIDETVLQRIANAVIVDFINFIGARNCVDYALYAKELAEEFKKNEKIRKKRENKR